MAMLTTIVLLSVLGLGMCSKMMAEYQFVEEWKLWKSEHRKSYQSDMEDLENHKVWLSNKKYIELHNANSHIFGYTLAMNRYGDMVSS